MASTHALKLELIPWDHASEEQVTRLYEQRIACGWRADEVPSYVESAEKAGKMFFWVVGNFDVFQNILVMPLVIAK